MYNDLYKAWKAEISTLEPQSLSSDFYQRMESYLGGLEQETTSIDEHTVKGRLALREKEIVTRLLHELKQARTRKLLLLAQTGEAIDDANLTEEERGFVKEFDKSLQILSQSKIETKPLENEEETIELSVVRFLQDIPEIVGTDLKMYGPYKKEDIGSLPAQNAQALVKQGAAREIEVRGISKPGKK